MAETDNAWKEALEQLFPCAMQFFLPEAASRVAWTRDPEALETGLRSLLPDSQTGLKLVDKLVKVWCRQTSQGELLEEGAEEAEFYHFEVQYGKETDFEKRINDYNDVARVHLHNHVVSVAILGDEKPDWRPEVYHWSKDVCELTFKFRVIKLLDWRGKEEELLADENPFALVVLAHLLIEPTEKEEEARAQWKLRLWQRACLGKMEPQDCNTLVRVIDWLLLLPVERNMPLLQQLADWRKENPMPFVSIFEQEILNQKQQIVQKEQEILKKDQQTRETCLAGIALGLKLKLAAAGEALLADVQKQTDLDWLRRFLTRIESAGSVQELRQLLP